jgi:hypothetical protein
LQTGRLAPEARHYLVLIRDNETTSCIYPRQTDRMISLPHTIRVRCDKSQKIDAGTLGILMIKKPPGQL